MMKRVRISVCLIGIMMAIWPLWGWAAPLHQADGTIPTPTEQPVSLTVEAIYTVPQDVVVDEPFDLVVSIRNGTPFIITDLVVTYRDVDDDKTLLVVGGSKSDTVPAPGSYLAITFSKTLRYLVDSPGRREIEVTFAYNYIIGEQITARTQTESIVFRVVEPTPTPTMTWTPTPTFTPTPDLLATFEFARSQDATATARALTLTPTSTPVPPVIVVVQPTEPERGESSTTPSPPPGETLGEAGASSVPSSATRAALVVEFEGVPTTVRPGDIFTMTLVVRNISTATVSTAVATWNTFEKAIVPIGRGTRWFLNDIRPGDKHSVPGQFYVETETPSGIEQVEVRIESRDSPRPADGMVNILVQATATPGAESTLSADTLQPIPEEPLWLRFLRALFGNVLPSER